MATIFCFTSTGNSLYTAKILAEKIRAKVVPIHDESIQIDDDVIGLVFPVYFWGLPRIVERFVAKIKPTNKDAYIFAIATCGGPVFGVLGELKKILLSKGTRLQYGKRLITVTNYLPEYKAKDSVELWQKIDKEIVKLADTINNRKYNRVLSTTFVNRIIYKMFPDENCDRLLTVAPACTGCETCKKVCPVKNITMRDGKPEFLHKCEHCLACVHHCPSQAIDWNRKTQGKGRYRNSKIPLDELITFNS